MNEKLSKMNARELRFLETKFRCLLRELRSIPYPFSTPYCPEDKYWKANASIYKIQDLRTEIRVCLGEHRAVDCPAFKKIEGENGYIRYKCWGRVMTPEERWKETLYKRWCSDCKLNWDKITSKSMMLRLSGRRKDA